MRVRYASMLAVVLVAAAVGAADPPIRVPVGPVVPLPMPPAPQPGSLRLTADTLFVIDGDAPFLVLASPAGLVSITEDAGPLVIRGRFADGLGKVETRRFTGKQVVTVEALATGRVELLVVPVGATKTTDVIRRTLDVEAGATPCPDPKPDPKPEPAPVVEGKRWLLIVEETADAGQSRGRLVTDPVLFQRIKDRGHVWRICDKDVKDAAGNTPADLKPYIERSAGKLPRLFIVAPDGKVLVDESCPADAAGVLELLRKAGG